MLKKSLSVVLFLVMLSSMLTVFSVGGASSAPNAEEPFAKTQNEIPLDEKIYCKATVDNDFANDTLLIILNHTASMANRKYDKSIFKETGNIESLEDLTYIEGDIETNDYVNKKLPIGCYRELTHDCPFAIYNTKEKTLDKYSVYPDGKEFSLVINYNFVRFIIPFINLLSRYRFIAYKNRK